MGEILRSVGERSALAGAHRRVLSSRRLPWHSAHRERTGGRQSSPRSPPEQTGRDRSALPVRRGCCESLRGLATGPRGSGKRSAAAESTPAVHLPSGRRRTSPRRERKLRGMPVRDQLHLSDPPRGVHQKREGSRQAVGYFTEYLKYFPDDTGVRWLLNVAYMTLGEYPEKVPAEHRLPLAPF